MQSALCLCDICPSFATNTLDLWLFSAIALVCSPCQDPETSYLIESVCTSLRRILPKKTSAAVVIRG